MTKIVQKWSWVKIFPGSIFFQLNFLEPVSFFVRYDIAPVVQQDVSLHKVLGSVNSKTWKSTKYILKVVDFYLDSLACCVYCRRYLTMKYMDHWGSKSSHSCNFAVGCILEQESFSQRSELAGTCLSVNAIGRSPLPILDGWLANNWIFWLAMLFLD